MWGKLGKDFWLFRFGQMVSVIGDACANIALAWWILEATGSAIKMSAVLAPAMAFRILFLPLFGPLGDAFERKRLVFFSDLWRFICFAAIAFLAFKNQFSLGTVVFLFIIAAMGTAIFESVSKSIVPQLVDKKSLQSAMQQNQAIDSIGFIAGGIIGGLIVSTLGVSGAFLINALSFLLSGLLALLITSDTRPGLSSKQKEKWIPKKALSQWFKDLKEGFHVIFRLKVVFYLSLVAMVLNLVLAPLSVALPVLIKELKGLPPWYLGAMESAGSLGAIAGSFVVGWLSRKFIQDGIVVVSIALIGLGVVIMPLFTHPLIPLLSMLTLGLGAAMANILMGTQESLATPDHFRSRLNSIGSFMSKLASPVGIGIAGFLIEGIGLKESMILTGVALLILSPSLLLIPLFSKFMRSSPDEIGSFFFRHYPGSIPEKDYSP